MSSIHLYCIQNNISLTLKQQILEGINDVDEVLSIMKKAGEGSDDYRLAYQHRGLLIDLFEFTEDDPNKRPYLAFEAVAGNR